MTRLRQAAAELWTLVALWQGLGEGDNQEPTVRRGAAFLAAQTGVAVALAAVVSLLKAAIVNEGDLSRGWLFGLFVPVLPLVAGVARTPPGLTVALAAAIPAGLATGALVWLAPGTGFWAWFATIACAALVAGPVFGALARDGVRSPA